MSDLEKLFLKIRVYSENFEKIFEEIFSKN